MRIFRSAVEVAWIGNIYVNLFVSEARCQKPDRKEGQRSFPLKLPHREVALANARASDTSRLLLINYLLEHVMQLERVRHSEQRRRTEPEWPTFSIGCHFNVIVVRVGIEQRRLHRGGHRDCFLWTRRGATVWQSVCE